MKYTTWWQAWGWSAFFFATSAFLWWYVTESLETGSGNRMVNGIILVIYLVAGKVGCVMLPVIPGLVSAVDGMYLLAFPAPATHAKMQKSPAEGAGGARKALGSWRVGTPDAAVVLYPSLKQPVALVLVGIVVTVGSALGVCYGAASGIWLFGFLGVVLFAGGLAIAFSPRVRLYLTEEGFEGGGLLRRFGYRWSEVGVFAVRTDPMSQRRNVAFATSPQDQAEGSNELPGQLSVDYGMSPEALADLLNSWRSRYASLAQGCVRAPQQSCRL